MTDILTAEEAADAIAAWWTQWLHKPAPMDNGSDSVVGNRIMAMKVAQSVQLVPQGAAALFELRLRALVLDCLLRGGAGQLPDVDYHPNKMLTAAAAAAGVNPEWIFPIKSSTYAEKVDGGFRVSVRLGYGADPVPLTRRDA